MTIYSTLLFLVFTGLCYALYRLLWTSLPFFSANRWLLLSMPVLAAGLAYGFPKLISTPPLPAFTYYLPTIALTATEGSSAAEASGTAFSLSRLLWWIYLAGMAIAALRLAFGLRNWWGLRPKMQALPQLGSGVYRCDVLPGPLNFFHWILLPGHSVKNPQHTYFLAHEKAHRRLGHSYDNLFYSLLKVLFWFNPGVYALHSQLRRVHEYQADAQTALGQRYDYARSLLTQNIYRPLPASAGQWVSSPFFNSSFIKTRITMLYQNPPTPRAYFAYLWLTPLLALMGLLASQVALAQKPQERQKEIPIVESLPMNEVDVLPRHQDCPVGQNRDEDLQCFQEAILRYVQENFEYPKELKALKLEGKCYVKFVINRQGRIEQAEVLRSLKGKTPEEKQAIEKLNQYLIDFVEQQASFDAPAQKYGKSVAMSFVLPINMRLGDIK